MEFIEFKAPDGVQLNEGEMALMSQVNGWMKKNFEKFTTGQKTGEQYAQEISAKLAEEGISKDTIDKLQNALKTQGEVLAGMREKGNPGAPKTIASILKEKEAELKSVKEGRSSMSFEIEAKEASTIMTTTHIDPQPNHYLPTPTVLPGIVRMVEPSQVIANYVSTGTISTPRIVWVNEKNGEGDAEFIPEGALKPLADLRVETEDENAKKVAVASKVSEEMLDDIPWMETEIRRLLTDKVLKKINKEIMTGDGAGANLNGILNRVGGYVQTCLNGTVKEPGLAEVLLAAATQIRNLGFDGRLIAFVNPCDWAASRMRKDGDGNIVDLRGVLDNITVVETSEIELGSFLIGDMSLFILEIYKALRVEVGWENDDFRRNLRTILAEARVLLRISDNHIGGFVYDTIANVKNLIAVPDPVPEP